MIARRTAVRHTLELGVGLILVALATRTWIVQGLIVPVTVSSGSMAQRILGPHTPVTCRQCRYRFTVAAEPAAGGTSRITCPLCGLDTLDGPAATALAGDQLLIDRTALSRGDCPRRWQVVVFRCPDRASQYGAKRVVALPGEEVAIRHGDVYIDGEIARKELPAQRAVAQLVHREAWDRQRRQPPRWRAEGERTGWQSCPGGFRYRLAEAAASQTPQVDWLGYHHLKDRPVDDAVAYNVGLSRVLHPVADLMLTFEVQATGEGQLQLRADDGRQRFEVSIPSRSGSLCVERDGRQVAQAPLPAGGLQRPRQLALSLFDCQLILAIDDRVAIRFRYPPGGDPIPPPPARPLAIGTRRLGVSIRQLAVWRDIYYTQPRWGGWAVRNACQLGGNQLFVLGDNSPISDDSRSWRNGPGLPTQLLVGTVARTR